MKAILIDPEKRIVEEVDIPGPEGDDYSAQLKGMRELIGCDCVCIGHAFPNGKDVIYCDDEVLLKDKPPALFRVGLGGQVVPGVGLVVGGDGQGGSADTGLTKDSILDELRWSVPLVEGSGAVFFDVKAREEAHSEQ